MNAPPSSCPSEGVIFDRPHTMSPADMARFLIELDAALGRDTFAPCAVQASVAEFRGWDGAKSYIRWKGILFWHTHSCEYRACVPAGSWRDNVQRCGTLRVLLWLATIGIEPSLWWRTPPRAELSVGKPYHLDSDEEAMARVKHEQFVADGVLRPLGAREWHRIKAQGQKCLASAFTVVQHKAIDSVEAHQAREDWAARHPDEVARYVSRDKKARPPAAAFKAKWRVVYDFKALNTATMKLPMSYGMQDEAFSKVAPGDTLMALDVQDGFTALPVAQHERHWFASVAQGQDLMIANRMPFGYRLAPFFFCLVSGMAALAVQAMLGLEGTTHMYMDDLLVAMRAGIRGTHAEWMQRCRALMMQCGLQISLEKVEGPAAAISYLGLRVKALPTTVEISMPSHKWFTLVELFKLVEAVRQAAGDGSSLTRGAVDSLVGKIGALATFLPVDKPDLAVLYRMKWWSSKPWAARRRMDPVRLTIDQAAALARLQAQVQAAPCAEVGGGRRAEDLPTFFGAVDASGEGGIGGHLRQVGAARSRCWSKRAAGAKAGDEWVGLSTILEMRAVLEAVRQLRAELSQIPQLLAEGEVLLRLAGDSQAAIALVKKGYSTRCGLTNDICRSVQQECREGGIRLFVTWVPRARNWRADRLSHPGHPAEDWQGSLPDRLDKMLEEDRIETVTDRRGWSRGGESAGKGEKRPSPG